MAVRHCRWGNTGHGKLRQNRFKGNGFNMLSAAELIRNAGANPLWTCSPPGRTLHYSPLQYKYEPLLEGFQQLPFSWPRLSICIYTDPRVLHLQLHSHSLKPHFTTNCAFFGKSRAASKYQNLPIIVPQACLGGAILLWIVATFILSILVLGLFKRKFPGSVPHCSCFKTRSCRKILSVPHADIHTGRNLLVWRELGLKVPSQKSAMPKSLPSDYGIISISRDAIMTSRAVLTHVRRV